MAKAARLRIDGRDYVVVARSEYERLRGLARVAEVPRLPEPDEHGNLPAVEYARASIARDIVLGRARLGLTQRELAQRARVRVETLCRIETGKHTPSVATIVKIERALGVGARVKKRKVPARKRA